VYITTVVAARKKLGTFVHDRKSKKIGGGGGSKTDVFVREGGELCFSGFYWG